MRNLPALSLLFLLPAGALQAQEFAPAPPPPAMKSPEATTPPAAAQEEEAAPEPQVTIIKRKEEIIEEYRLNGQLYMIKITPNKGYPYYLIDTDGDGSFETRRNELDNPPVTQWKILRW